MTTAEVCNALGCDKTTLMRNWREIETVATNATAKTVKHGKSTYWTEAEVTLLLEKMKTPVSSGKKSKQQRSVAGTETSQSLDLQLAVIERKAHELWKRKALEQEERAVRAERQLLMAQELLIERESGLSTYQRIAEAGSLVMSDRDDVLATYGRQA